MRNEVGRILMSSSRIVSKAVVNWPQQPSNWVWQLGGKHQIGGVFSIDSKEKMWTVAPAELGGRKASLLQTYRITSSQNKQKPKNVQACFCSLYLFCSQKGEKEKLIPLFTATLPLFPQGLWFVKSWQIFQDSNLFFSLDYSFTLCTFNLFLSAKMNYTPNLNSSLVSALFLALHR